MIIYPYKPGSESSKNLAQALGIKRISHRNSRFRGSPDTVVVNWGASELPEEVSKCNVLNKPGSVYTASNKLAFFRALSPEFGEGAGVVNVKSPGGRILSLRPEHSMVIGLSAGDECHECPGWFIDSVKEKVNTIARVPKYTTDKDIVYAWLLEGYDVVARTVLTGCGGKGIVYLPAGSPEEAVVNAPLYVMYVPKKQEYRVHVCDGVVVDVQRKARRKEVADKDINWKIRNHDNGFIFARGEALGDVPEDVLTQSLLAMKTCDLDFGAVDVVFNSKEKLAYVLEINTAPGLTGSTLDGYVERLRKFL